MLSVISVTFIYPDLAVESAIESGMKVEDVMALILFIKFASLPVHAVNGKNNLGSSLH